MPASIDQRDQSKKPLSIRRPVLATIAILGLTGTTPGSQAPGVSIEHAGIGCAAVGRFVEVEAKLAPPASIAQARVLFRGENSEHWYFTSLAADPKKAGRYVGHIPKPLASLKTFEYYVTATDTAFGEARTPDRRVSVVQGATCANGLLGRSAEALAGRLVVSAVSGGAALPVGFASTGLIAGSAAGATTAAAGAGGGGAGAGAAGAAAGGGISGATFAIAGGVIAAGAGVAVAGGAAGGEGDKGDEGSCCHAGVFNIAFGPFLDMTPCGGAAMGITGGNFDIPSGVKQPQGNFDDQIGSGPGAGTGLRLAGFISPTSFTATLSCAGGAPNSVSLQGTGSNYNFTGSLTFGSRTSTWTVKTWGT